MGKAMNIMEGSRVFSYGQVQIDMMVRMGEIFQLYKFKIELGNGDRIGRGGVVILIVT